MSPAEVHSGEPSTCGSGDQEKRSLTQRRSVRVGTAGIQMSLSEWERRHGGGAGSAFHLWVGASPRGKSEVLQHLGALTECKLYRKHSLAVGICSI